MGPRWGSKRPATYAKSGGERREWSGGEGYIERSCRRLFERGARVRRRRSPMYPSPERSHTRPGLRSAPDVSLSGAPKHEARSTERPLWVCGRRICALVGEEAHTAHKTARAYSSTHGGAAMLGLMQRIAAFVASSLILVVACTPEDTTPTFTSASASGSGGASSASGGGNAATGGGAGGSACSDNLDTDPNNCGLCGHSCLGGECLAGSCQPITIALDVPSPVGMVANGDTLYLSSNGATVGDYRIFRMPWNGAATPLYAAADVGAFAAPLLVAGDRLVFAQNNKLLAITTAAPSSYSDAIELVPTSNPHTIWLHNAYVYAAAAANDGGLVRAKWGEGNGASAWASLASAAAGAAADDSGLYYSLSNSGELMHAQLDGAGPTTLAQLGAPLFDVALFGDSIMVAAGGPAVWRVAKDGSNQELVVDVDANNQVRSFTTAATKTFFWCDGKTGDVYYLPAVGAARRLVEGDTACEGITYAQGVLYWFGGGNVTALALTVE